MSKYSVYIVLGLIILYFLVKMNGGNRKKDRKSRKFMDGKRKHD